MDVFDLVKSRRTIRKYKRETVSRDLIIKFIDAARFSPSVRNQQPVRYMIVEGEKADSIFPYTHWLASLKGAHSPSFEERPPVYILFLVPQGQSPKYDVGAIAQSIGLMAFAEGLGTCWMASLDRGEISSVCDVPPEYEIDTLLALGYPAELPVACVAEGGHTTYFLADDDVLHVPKVGIEELIL